MEVLSQVRMSYTKKLTTFSLILFADFLTFLLILPSLTPAVPSDFWQFLAAFFALFAICNAIIFGLFGRGIRSRKSRIFPATLVRYLNKHFE